MSNGKAKWEIWERGQGKGNKTYAGSTCGAPRLGGLLTWKMLLNKRKKEVGIEKKGKKEKGGKEGEKEKGKVKEIFLGQTN